MLHYGLFIPYLLGHHDSEFRRLHLICGSVYCNQNSRKFAIFLLGFHGTQAHDIRLMFMGQNSTFDKSRASIYFY